ncbi:MAG: hypothetical protein KA791_12535 [Flavobacteriales bacterium]|nr:hypothetical protein [Flavobacteriales bacterium]
MRPYRPFGHSAFLLIVLFQAVACGLHDDFGSTLSSINILSTVARRKAEAGDEAGAAASLSGISERTQRLMYSPIPTRERITLELPFR